MCNLVKILLLAAVALALCGGQAMADEWKAADSHLDVCHDHSLDPYLVKVDAISLKAMPGAMKLMVRVLPSFIPEWAVGVTAQGGTYRLTAVEFNQSLWASSWVKTGRQTMQQDFSVAKATVTAHTVRISTELYQLLATEWHRSIRAARPPDISGARDGTSYYFKLPSGECGLAWSPDQDSRNGRLVALVDALRAAAKKKAQAQSDKTTRALLKQVREIPNAR